MLVLCILLQIAHAQENKLSIYKHQIICETVCYQDGDEAGFVIKGQCYCANKRDVTKIITKVQTKIEKESKVESQIRW